jgi:hypothetical protein
MSNLYLSYRVDGSFLETFTRSEVIPYSCKSLILNFENNFLKSDIYLCGINNIFRKHFIRSLKITEKELLENLKLSVVEHLRTKRKLRESFQK